MIIPTDDAPGLTLAYLDPVSWLAAAQVIGGVSAWLAVRFRRLRRRTSGQGPVSDLTDVQLSEAVKIFGTPGDAPRLVVAIEGPRDWPYLEAYLHALVVDRHDLELWIVSAGDLPDLGSASLGPIKAVFDVSRRDWLRLMSSLTDATVLTTVTDLGSKMFPKAASRVRYVYAFHSLVSTHVAYRAEAFDHYDVVFSPSRQHTSELRLREQAVGVAPKRIIGIGYPYVDALVQRAVAEPQPQPKTIVIAPSWTSDDHYPTTWMSAAEAFARHGWNVAIRPHPETLKRSPGIIRGLEAAIAAHPGIQLDRSAQDGAPLPNVAALVSDWSGAAIEFALAGRPVAFVDTPRKVRNAAWRVVSDDSLEQDLRAAAGVIVAPKDVQQLPSLMSTHASLPTPTMPEHAIYNSGTAAHEGAQVLLACLRGEFQ